MAKHQFKIFFLAILLSITVFDVNADTYHFNVCSANEHVVYSSDEVFCNAMVPKFNACPNYGSSVKPATFLSVSHDTCRITRATGTVMAIVYTKTAKPVCTPPQVNDPVTDLCVDVEPEPECELSGKAPDLFYSFSSPSVTQCDGLCVIQQQKVPNLVDYANKTGNCLTTNGNRIVNGNENTATIGCWMPANYTGDTCSTNDIVSAPSSSPISTQSECTATGGVWGTINEVPTCVRSSPPPTTGTTPEGSENPNADGGTGTTEGTNPENNQVPDYQNSGGTLNGSNGGDGQNGEPAPDLCVTNPNIDACKNTTSGTAVSTSKEGIYTRTTNQSSISTSLTNAMAIIENSPIFTASTGFFNTSGVTGSCGGMDQTFEVYGQSFVVEMNDIFCGDTAQIIFDILGYGVMLLAGYTAFRYAIL